MRKLQSLRSIIVWNGFLYFLLYHFIRNMSIWTHAHKRTNPYLNVQFYTVINIENYSTNFFLTYMTRISNLCRYFNTEFKLPHLEPFSIWFTMEITTKFELIYFRSIAKQVVPTYIKHSRLIIPDGIHIIF